MNERQRPARFQRVQEGPRKVRAGLKLKATDAALAAGPLAPAWLSLVHAAVGAERMAQGLEYARAGQAISLDVEPGVVRALVQGRAAKPYQTRLLLQPLTAAQWDRLISAMAGEAIHAAKLLGGELPPTLAELCASLGFELIPAAGAELCIECSCSEGVPCKHAAVAGYLLAERLLSEPLLILTLRGMNAERLMERLRGERDILTHGISAAHGESLLGEHAAAGLPLEQCIDEFWRCGPQLKDLELAPPPQHISHALLRRLGPSPLNGKFPLVGLLASVYDEVTKAALRIRDHAEGLDLPPLPEGEGRGEGG